MTQQSIPTGIERLLGMAAADETFAAELRNHRAAILAKSNLSFAPTEQALLCTIDAATLDAMIAGVKKNLPDSERRAFLSMAASAMMGLVGGSALASSLAGCADRCPPTRGVQPDRPKAQAPEPVPSPAGIRPDKSKPQAPDPAGTITGIRPDRPKPKAPPTSLPSPAGAGARSGRPFDSERSVGKGGVRADRPKKKNPDEK